MHIAFLDANTDRSPLAARNPSEAEKFRALLHPFAPDWVLADFRATEGAFPETLEGFDGIMVSGSPASVNDDGAWIARLLDLIRQAASRDLPVFGACFGHQAVAQALGGTVGRNPQGWVLGRVQVSTLAPAPWMQDAPAELGLHAAHNEQVLIPPPGARTLGGTLATPHGHLALGRHIFSTQYHPEITPDFMDQLIEALEGHIAPEAMACARASLRDSLGSEVMARWIVTFFQQARA